MATEQQLYEFGTRIDHPVFSKDMSTVTDADSPFNSIMNRLFAKQMVKLQAAIASLKANSFPQTCDENTIDRWEETYAISNADLSIEERRAAILVKRNQKLTMSVATVEALAIAITGQTPIITRSLWLKGWVIGSSTIGKTTYIAGGSAGAHSTIYILRFAQSLSSAQKKLLDKTLTQIEKGGSSHSIISPERLWVIGRSAIGIDTTVGS